MEPVELLVKYALEAGVIIGLTSVLGKFLSLFRFWSEKIRDGILPLVAMCLGVGVITVPKVMAGEPVTAQDFMVGVVLGGTVTGLYAVVKPSSKK